MIRIGPIPSSFAEMVEHKQAYREDRAGHSGYESTAYISNYKYSITGRPL